jgi:hypothetical protein
MTRFIKNSLRDGIFSWKQPKRATIQELKPAIAMKSSAKGQVETYRQLFELVR